MADTSQSEADPPITNGVTTEDEDERLKQRPADIDAVSSIQVHHAAFPRRVLCCVFRVKPGLNHRIIFMHLYLC